MLTHCTCQHPSQSAVLGLSLIVGGAIDVFKTTDDYSKRVDGGGTILAADVDPKTRSGALVVEYKVDGNPFRVYDIVTDRMTCEESEKWLRDMQERKSSTANVWPVVRCNPRDYTHATLVENKYHGLAITFLGVGLLLLSLSVTIFLFRYVFHIPLPKFLSRLWR